MQTGTKQTITQNSLNGELAWLCLAKFLRTLILSSVSLVLALFLKTCGFSTFAIGAIISATIIEDAVVTPVVAAFTYSLGMLRVLTAASFLIVAGGLIMCFANQPWLIVLAVILGIISPAGYEGGPFASVEQTLIARGHGAHRLTKALSYYNIAGFAGAALGALLAGEAVNFATATATAANAGAAALVAYRAIFLSYAATGLILATIYGGLSLRRRHWQEQIDDAAKTTAAGVKAESAWYSVRGRVLQLCALQGLDSFGGGFVAQTLIAYWFLLRFNAGAELTGPLFCLANLLAALSFLMAPMFVRRFGLLNTMVFTHLPCSLALVAVPLMPSAMAAAVLLALRSIFSSMDIPVRQAYEMLLVKESERPKTAALISSSRAIGQGLAPALSTAAMTNPLTGLPFVLAGLCKTVYDLSLFVCFKNVAIVPSQRQTLAAARAIDSEPEPALAR